MVGKHYIYEFQFLLGRLKTLITAGLVYLVPVFQFLLGRLKTGESRSARFWPA